MLPEIQLTESIHIPSYYLVISLVACLALFWIYRRSESQNFPIPHVLDLSLVIMLSGLIGARAFHILFESPDHYLQNPREVFNIANGGFVFFGGFLMALVSSLLYLHFKKLPIRDYLDLFAPVLSLSYGLGRIACLLAGCCYGKSCELPWAIAGRHPTQLYAVIAELSIVGLLLLVEKNRQQLKFKSGDVFFLWISLHGLSRLFMEQFRDDFRGPTLGLSISSWISILLIITGLSLLALPKLRK